MESHPLDHVGIREICTEQAGRMQSSPADASGSVQSTCKIAVNARTDMVLRRCAPPSPPSPPPPVTRYGCTIHAFSPDLQRLDDEDHGVSLRADLVSMQDLWRQGEEEVIVGVPWSLWGIP